jgi:hypothetical protein
MLVLDALFDHIQQISSNVEIIGILVQFAQFRQLMSELGPVATHTAEAICSRTSAAPRKRTWCRWRASPQYGRATRYGEIQLGLFGDYLA